MALLARDKIRNESIRRRWYTVGVLFSRETGLRPGENRGEFEPRILSGNLTVQLGVATVNHADEYRLLPSWV